MCALASRRDRPPRPGAGRRSDRGGRFGLEAAGPVQHRQRPLPTPRGRLLVGEGGADRVGRGQAGRARPGPADAARRRPDRRAPGPSRRGAAPRAAPQDRPGGGDAVPPALPARASAPARASTRSWHATARRRSRSPSLAALRSRSRLRSCWSARKAAGPRGSSRWSTTRSRSETACCGSRPPQLAAGALLTALRSSGPVTPRREPESARRATRTAASRDRSVLAGEAP